MMMILLRTQDIETINKYSQLTTQLVRVIIDKTKSLNFLFTSSLCPKGTS